MAKVSSFEGSVHVKGWTIAYIVWLPPQTQSTVDETDRENKKAKQTLMPDEGYKTYKSTDQISMTNEYETMVCSHGWLDNANSFSMIAPLIANQLNMRVIALDLPGHGKSSHSITGYYTGEDYDIALVRFLHALDIHDFHMITHSLSSSLFPFLLPLLPAKWKVRSLICVEQFAMLRTSTHLDQVDLNEFLDQHNSLQEIHTDENMLSRGLMGSSPTSLMLRSNKLYDSLDDIARTRMYVTANKYPGKQFIAFESAKKILERNSQKIATVETENNQRITKTKYCLSFDPVLKSGATNNLSLYAFPKNAQAIIEGIIVKKLKCPILCVFGKSGWPGLDFIAKHLESKMSNLKLVYLEGSHHLHMDNAPLCMTQIAPFLTQVIQDYTRQDTSHLHSDVSKNKSSKL